MTVKSEELKNRLKRKDNKILELQSALEKAEVAKQIIAQTNRLLDQELYKSTIVAKVGEIIAYVSDYDETVRHLMELVSQIVNFDAGVLLLARGEDKMLGIYINGRVSRGFLDELEKKAVETFNKETEGSLTLTGFLEKIIYGKVATAKDGGEDFTDLAVAKVKTFCASALRIGNEVFGVIAIGNGKTSAFAKGEIDSFNIIANQATIVIDDAALYKNLKVAHEKLKIVDQMKSDFVSHVSHELRTPLTTMREANAQLLEGLKGPLNEGQKRFLEISQKGVDRLSRIINNLLDLSRLEAGKIKLERSQVDIVILAREVMDSLRPQVSHKRINLEDKMPASLPEIYVDPDRIRQVFINLLGNALKYTGDGGKITLTAEKKGDRLEASIDDTGIGIPPEHIDKIFERFERVSKIPIPGVGGAGLGLPICRELLNLHKGHVCVESTLGKGSKFTFSLPIYKEADFLRDYLGEQIQEAKRYHSFVSLIMVNISNLSKLKKDFGKEALSQVEKQLKDLIEKYTRDPMDKVFKYRDGTLALVLIGTPKENGQAVEKRLRDAAAKQEFKAKDIIIKPSLKFKEVTFPVDAETEEEMIEKAKDIISG